MIQKKNGLLEGTIQKYHLYHLFHYTVTYFGLDRQITLKKMSQGKGNTKITLVFQGNRWLLYYIAIQQFNAKTQWKKFWNIIEAFQDIWVFKDTKIFVWDVKYGLPFIALIDASVFPESWLKLYYFLLSLKYLISEECKIPSSTSMTKAWTCP